MKQMLKVVMLLVMFLPVTAGLSTAFAQSQKVTFSGVVSDPEGEPLPESSSSQRTIPTR